MNSRDTSCVYSEKATFDPFMFHALFAVRTMRTELFGPRRAAGYFESACVRNTTAPKSSVSMTLDSLTSSGILACRPGRKDLVRDKGNRKRTKASLFCKSDSEKLVRKRESTRADSKPRAYEIAATLEREGARELKVKRKRASWRQRVESKGVQW